MFGHHSHDRTMDDGGPVLAVLGVDDDIAFKAVLAVSVGWVVHVRCLSVGDNGSCRLVVDENEVASINATDFSGLVMDHGF